MAPIKDLAISLQAQELNVIQGFEKIKEFIETFKDALRLDVKKNNIRLIANRHGETFNEEAENFPRWKTHCSTYLKRIQEWYLVWRNDPKICNNNTSNITEASMKLLKIQSSKEKKKHQPGRTNINTF